MSTATRTMRHQDHKRGLYGQMVLVAASALVVVDLLTGWLLFRSQPVHNAAVSSATRIVLVIPNAQPWVA